MTQLSTAYETLSDENRRTKYDATLPWSQTLRQPPQPANWPYQGSYDYVWSKLARERADRARREDPDYWSGPTYAHGATYCSGSSKQWDEEQKDAFDKYERRQQERAARREARKEAESKERDMNRPPPSQEPFDQGSETFKARPGKSRKKEEARAKTEGEAREDDDNWGNPPSPPKPHSDRWYKTEKETKEEYQKRSDKESRRADRRKAKREQSEKQWSTELMILLSKIVSTEVDIEDTEAKVNEAKRATNGEREDDDHEQIFHLQIRRKSLERRLQERIDEYKLIVKYLRDQGWEHEADEANVKLREVCSFSE